MEDFDEIIKPFLDIKIKRKTINIQNQDPRITQICPPGCTKEIFRPGSGARVHSRKVITPDGTYDSINQAAIALNLTDSVVKYRCEHWTKHNFFYEVE